MIIIGLFSDKTCGMEVLVVEWVIAKEEKSLRVLYNLSMVLSSFDIPSLNSLMVFFWMNARMTILRISFFFLSCSIQWLLAFYVFFLESWDII